MKAMVLRAPRELAADNVAIPKLSAGQVLVRVTHSGVCGTDLKIFNGAIPVHYPLIMGHEATGEVVDAGGQPGIRAGAISQPKVHQHDVGLQFGGAGDRLSDGPSVSDDGHVALVVDQGGEAICDHLMVLDD